MFQCRDGSPAFGVYLKQIHNYVVFEVDVETNPHSFMHLELGTNPVGKGSMHLVLHQFQMLFNSNHGSTSRQVRATRPVA